ncbi:MAG: hypothetical protein U9R38_07100 [Candidatus Margulisiibacteriota bacterium]|nr:hypothetical protein [Candidatus Margulisiibacteriota bacterium]
MRYKNLALILILVIALAGSAAAQKVIKKTVKKVITPQISPVQPPKTEVTPEVVPEVPPPPPPPTYEVQTLEEDKGLFGWGINSNVSGKLLYGSILAGIRGDIVFSDPLMIGEKIGLAEDAVEYRVGSGFSISDKLKTIPLYADAVVYLKEGSLFGTDGYIGTGLSYNLYGTGQQSGGLGGQFYVGILTNLGLEERAGINIGYASYNVGSNLSDSGIYISLSQPLKL